MKTTHSFTRLTLGFISLATGIGTLVALALGCMVMLLALPAHGQTVDEVVHSESQRFMQPTEATRGSLLFKGENDFMTAPLLRTEVHIDISGMIARARVKQSFSNPDSQWKEGVYVFPLPADAAVDHMRVHVGERIIEGRIREKGEARKQYERARRQGKKAGLVEQERPNIFTTSVANIGPDETIIVEIEYQQIVQYDRGGFSLRFPMVVGPRYIPGTTRVTGFSGSGWGINTDQVPDAARITPPVLHPDQGKINPVSIEINLDAGFKLAQIDSPYHSINTEEPSGTRYRITLDEGEVPADRDFVLDWKPVPGKEPRAALFHEHKDNDDYALLMVLPPERRTTTVLTREIIYVIDTSGSMGGASLRQARAALELALTRLRAGDRFNIIQFNSTTSQLFQFPQPVGHQSLRQARNYVSRLRATGGTEMAPAILAALRNQENGSDIRQVIFLTDGSVGNETALFKLITDNLGDSRLFTVGIGSAPNSHFMQRAAAFGRGTYTYIGKPEEVKEKMDALFTKLESPVLSDIAVHWSGAAAMESWPQKIPDLYQGEPLLVTAKANTLPESITLTGQIAGSQWRTNLSLKGGRERPGIGVLWARRKIAALMNQQATGTEADAIRKQITDTALDHHLVSKYTSLVAVDVTPSRPRSAALARRNIPINLPAGWEYEKVFGVMPQTATPALLDFLIGAVLLLTGLLARLTRILRLGVKP